MVKRCPATIVTQKICTPLPPGSFEHADLHRQQWRCVQYLANVFWERWRKEYLSTVTKGGTVKTFVRPVTEVVVLMSLCLP